jgi:hypothetical protein
MHATRSRGIWLLAAWLALVPTMVHAQQYAPADVTLPVPIGSTRPEDGGIYVGAGVVMYRQTNPLQQQLVAVRGLYAYETGGRVRAIDDIQIYPIGPLPPGVFLYTGLDGNFLVGDPPTGTQIAGGVITIFQAGAATVVGQYGISTVPQTIQGLFDTPGFKGSGQAALDVDQLRTRKPFQPGSDLTIGYRFSDGSAIELNWLYLTEAKYTAGASVTPRNFVLGVSLEDTFLFSPVYNFPPEFAGAPFKVNVPFDNNALPPLQQLSVNSQTVFGAWNGASIMTLEFRQRFQQWQINYRTPIWETEVYRMNALVGPRFAWIWERFKWVSTTLETPSDDSVDALNNLQSFSAVYTNITSNRMYGVHVGCQQECYIGHGLAVMLDTRAALFLNSVKERGKYKSGFKYDGLPASKRARREWSVVPELTASLGMMWYPTEYIQIYGGYDLMVFFNTLASRKPIDFNFANVNPTWSHVNRVFDGWRAGLAITF